MGDTTGIQWTRHSASPWYLCTEVTDECAHCYAKALSRTTMKALTGGAWGKGTARIRSKSFVADVTRWHQRQAAMDETSGRVPWTPGARGVFPSLCDILDAEAPLEWRREYFELCEATPCLLHLGLTKRPENWRSSVPPHWLEEVPPNFMLGISGGRAQPLWERWCDVRATGCRNVFLSLEPLLEDVSTTLDTVLLEAATLGIRVWVIAGGESGVGARSCFLQWLRGIVRVCDARGFPVFIKQLGAQPVGGYAPAGGVGTFYGLQLKDKKGGDLAEWPEDLRRREWPRQAQSSFVAPAGSAVLTLATLTDVLAEIPKPPQWRYCAVQPEHAQMLHEIQPRQSGEAPIVGIEIHEKPGQVADSWMFRDAKMLRKYLSGELSELDLVELTRTGACQPNA